MLQTEPQKDGDHLKYITIRLTVTVRLNGLLKDAVASAQQE